MVWLQMEVITATELHKNIWNRIISKQRDLLNNPQETVITTDTWKHSRKQQHNKHQS